MSGVVIVTGSRKWPLWTVVHAALDREQPTLVVHGGALGADLMAATWAMLHGVTQEPWPANWKLYGRKRAGPIRNRQMLAAHPGAAVLAFPHPTLPSPGTRGCMKLAKKFGHPLRVYALTGELVEED